MGRKLNDIINSLPAQRKAEVESLARKKVDDMLAYAKTLADFRKAVGKTQTEVASELGIKQHAVSQLEQRSDMYVSTLQRFVQSLGMRLEFSLTTANGVRIELRNFHPWQDVSAQNGAAKEATPSRPAAHLRRTPRAQPTPPARRAAGGETGTGKRSAAASASRKAPARLTTTPRLP